MEKSNNVLYKAIKTLLTATFSYRISTLGVENGKTSTAITGNTGGIGIIRTGIYAARVGEATYGGNTWWAVT